ncbi:MAG TPA: hypothetical protein DD454_01910 [Candidatus Moranbacteria bacterium]|nr:hypothetical protein [Candidatus Moranbacteria bacterium]
MRKILVAVFWLGVVFPAGIADAKEFGEALSEAFSSIPAGADAASIGNTDAANEVFSSNNPAIVPTLLKDEHKVGLSGTYGSVRFGRGPDVDLYLASAAVRLPLGVFALTYADANSGWSATDPFFGPEMKFVENPTIDLKYGLKVRDGLFFQGDQLNAGIGYVFGESRLKFRFSQFIEDFGVDVPVAIKSESRSHAGTVGVFYKPRKNVSVGAYYSHIWSSSKDTTDVAGGLFVEEVDSKIQSDQFRIGAGWRIVPLTYVTVDYRHLDMEGEKLDQVFAGIEQGFRENFPLFLYVGWADQGLTGGLGFYLENGGLNLGYMHRPFRDLEPFLGKSEVLMATAFWNF